MRLESKLDIKTEAVPVALVMQSLEILSMNAEELQESIQKFIESNPMVDYSNSSAGTETQFSFTDFGSFESESLEEHIVFQLGILSDDSELVRIGAIIAGSLDKDGYLRETNNDMAEACGCTEERYKAALDLVKSCDPAGVGASCLAECLLIQLKTFESPVASIAAEIVRNHLFELAEGTVSIEGCTEEEIEDACRLVRSLNPRPGSGFEREWINYILPDVLIEDEGDGLLVSLINQPSCPLLFENYHDYLKAEDEREREYIRHSLARARSFIYSIKKRERTIFSIADIAVQQQTEYIKTGEISKLKPLTMAACAEISGVSLSTASRCINGKYAEYNGRIIPLKILFTSGGTGTFTREYIVERIKDIRSQYPEASDRTIAESLAAEGIHVSRRTVNKYRNMFIELIL